MDVTSVGPQWQSESNSGRLSPVDQPHLSSIRTGPRKAGSGVGPEGPAPSILIHRNKSVPNRLEHGEKGVFSKRLARIAAHVESNREFAQYVAQFDPERAQDLSRCGSYLMFREYFKMEGKPKKLAGANFCNRPLWCGFCAARQSARQSAALLDKLREAHRLTPASVPYMLTLTAKDEPDLDAMQRRIWGAWSKLIQRRANARKGKGDSIAGTWEGGFVSGEAKRGKNSGEWHYHLHGIVLGPGGRYKPMFMRLKREWQTLLGQKQTASIQFESIRNYRENGTQAGNESAVLGAVLEAAKYAIKVGCNDDHADRFEAATTLAGVRRIRTFGSLYRAKLPTSLTDDLTEYEGQVYRELLFRYLDGSYQKRQTPAEYVAQVMTGRDQD